MVFHTFHWTGSALRRRELPPAGFGFFCAVFSRSEDVLWHLPSNSSRLKIHVCLYSSRPHRRGTHRTRKSNSQWNEAVKWKIEGWELINATEDSEKKSTVKNTLQQLFAKADVRTRSQLVCVALEQYGDLLYQRGSQVELGAGPGPGSEPCPG